VSDTTGRAAEQGDLLRRSARRIVRRAVFALAALMLLTAVGTAVTLYAQGYRVWVVHTGSMEPTYLPGDVIIDRPPNGQVHAGQVITFRHSDLTTDVVTHRVTDVTKAGLIHTKGDANRTADVWDIRPDQVQGSVMFKIKSLGYVLVFLQQPAGIAAMATLTFALVLLWQLFFNEADTETDSDTAEPEPINETELLPA
jgi:signal peptidase I